MRKSLTELSLNFIGKAEDNLAILKNPLSVVDPAQMQKEAMTDTDSKTVSIAASMKIMHLVESHKMLNEVI